jgi:hypothetical protein
MGLSDSSKYAVGDAAPALEASASLARQPEPYVYETPKGELSLHPFQIIPAGAAKIRVCTGAVMTGLSATSSASITNLNADKPITATSLIFLHWNVDDGYSIKVGTTWSGYPTLAKHDGSSPPEQTDYWVLIGYVGAMPGDAGKRKGFSTKISGTAYWVYQCLRNDLLETDICMNGRPTRYPFPFTGPKAS